MNLKISTIVPVYNAESTLERCLKSILAQSLKEFEIICINDGSNDLSLKILENFSKDERVKIVNRISEGYGSALNIGLNLALGEYIAIIEPKDFIDRKMFEKLYKLGKSTEADIVKSSFYRVFENSKIKPQKTDWEKQCKIPSWYFRINECPSFFFFEPSIWSCIYKKSFLNGNSIRFVQAKGKAFCDNPYQVETMLLAQKIAFTGCAYYYRHFEEDTIGAFQENLTAPFERSEEMFQILLKQKVKDKNIYANIYKRVLLHIERVLKIFLKNDIKAGQTGFLKGDFDIKAIPYEIQLGIESVVSKMNEDIIKNNPYINAFERELFGALSRVKSKGNA